MKQKKLKMKIKTIINKKAGFTLAEVLMAMGIIGILTALALTTIVPAQKSATKYQYMSAYNALSTAYYNTMLDNSKNPFLSDPTYVHSEEEDTGTEILCKGLTSFINTFSNGKDDDKDYATTCSATKITSVLADEFLDENVQFTATNGMKFYISNLIKETVSVPVKTNPGHYQGIEFQFYIVYVDLNGNGKPNSILYTNKSNIPEPEEPLAPPSNASDEEKAQYQIELEKYQKDLERYNDEMAKNLVLPDIYAFILLPSGRIMPIGIPEYDKNVLSARFIYYDNANEMKHSFKSVAYYQAKGSAWGYYNNTGAEPQPTDYNEDEPFSMNDVIRTAIETAADDAEDGSYILKDFPNLKQLEPLAIQKNAPYHCSNKDLESCYVFLDEYR